MFFSIQLLGRGTPLSTLWLAAHADSRLKRNDINTTSVKNSVDKILHPEMPLALRLSGMLMLGVVRIYKRQLQYLYDDCQSTINKLEKANKQASKRATEKAGGRSSKADLHAKNADISIRDEPAKAFNFAALDADEEGFGLFEDHQTSSMEALADVEAQHSFQNIDAELFSQLGPEDSLDPSTDSPERLRAVSEYSEDLGPALPPMDDMLPRMTPNKKANDTSEVPSPHVSRDGSVKRGSLGRSSLGNLDQEEMLPQDMEMDLPPILPPTEDEVEGSAPSAKVQKEADQSQNGVAAMDEDAPPAPPEDPVQADQDAPMDELPPMNPDEDMMMNDVAPDPALEPKVDDPIEDDEQDKNASEADPASNSKPKRAVQPVKKPRRKVQGTGQRLRQDSQNSKLSTDQVREMLKNRKPLYRERQPLVALPLQQENWMDTDDLDILMQPSCLREQHLSTDMRVLMKSIGQCKPVSFFAFMGDSSKLETESKHAEELRDEIEDDEHVPDPEELRKATPKPTPGQDVPTPRGDFGADVPDDPGTLDMAEELPNDEQMMEEDAPPMMDMDVPPMMGDDFPAPPEDVPDMPQEVDDSAVPASSKQQQDASFVPRDDLPSQGGAEEMQEEMWGGPSMPATQPSQDTSLNPHTVRTLEKLQELAQARSGSSRKREREQHILMSSLTPQTCSRSEAAKYFYDVLVLQAKGVLHMREQTTEYEDLNIVLLDEEA